MTETTHKYSFKKGDIVDWGEIFLVKDFPNKKSWYELVRDGLGYNVKIIRDIEFNVIIKEGENA